MPVNQDWLDQIDEEAVHGELVTIQYFQIVSR